MEMLFLLLLLLLLLHVKMIKMGAPKGNTFVGNHLRLKSNTYKVPCCRPALEASLHPHPPHHHRRLRRRRGFHSLAKVPDFSGGTPRPPRRRTSRPRPRRRTRPGPRGPTTGRGSSWPPVPNSDPEGAKFGFQKPPPTSCDHNIVQDGVPQPPPAALPCLPRREKAAATAARGDGWLVAPRRLVESRLARGGREAQAAGSIDFLQIWCMRSAF